MPRKQTTPRNEFFRALIQVLERRGYANLALALVRCLQEEQDGTGNPAEMDALLEAGKRVMAEYSPNIRNV